MIIKYNETLTKADEPLEVVPDGGWDIDVQVLEVTRMGPDLMWRYVVKQTEASDVAQHA